MRNLSLWTGIAMYAALLLAPAASRGGVPATDYVVGYIHTLTVYDDSSGGLDGNGEVMIIVSTSDGTNNTVVKFPQDDWEITKVTDQVLTRYPDPFNRTKRKLNLRDTNRPWGMPFFSARVDELPEVLGLTISVVETDEPGDVALTLADLAGPVGGAAATLAGADPASSRSVTGFIDAAVRALKSFWEMDTLMVHGNVFGKAALLERVRRWNATADLIRVSGDATNVDGEVSVGYVFRKVRVPTGARIRVTMGDVRHYDNGDSFFEPSGEIIVYTHVWNGLWDGLTPHGDSYRFRKEDLDEGSWWRLSRHSHRVLYDGELGPFLAANFGVWDEDDNDNDLMGNIFGLWLTDDLIEGLNREPGRKVTYVVDRTEDGRLKSLKFDLELRSGGIDGDPLNMPDGVDLNQAFEVCRTIRNNSGQAVDLNVVFKVDGVQIAERTVTIAADRHRTVCFPYTFTDPADDMDTHQVNITVDGALGWPDGRIAVPPMPW